MHSWNGIFVSVTQAPTVFTLKYCAVEKRLINLELTHSKFWNVYQILLSALPRTYSYLLDMWNNQTYTKWRASNNCRRMARHRLLCSSASVFLKHKLPQFAKYGWTFAHHSDDVWWSLTQTAITWRPSCYFETSNFAIVLQHFVTMHSNFSSHKMLIRCFEPLPFIGYNRLFSKLGVKGASLTHGCSNLHTQNNLSEYFHLLPYWASFGSRTPCVLDWQRVLLTGINRSRSSVGFLCS